MEDPSAPGHPNAVPPHCPVDPLVSCWWWCDVLVQFVPFLPVTLLTLLYSFWFLLCTADLRPIISAMNTVLSFMYGCQYFHVFCLYKLKLFPSMSNTCLNADGYLCPNFYLQWCLISSFSTPPPPGIPAFFPPKDVPLFKMKRKGRPSKLVQYIKDGVHNVLLPLSAFLKWEARESPRRNPAPSALQRPSGGRNTLERSWRGSVGKCERVRRVSGHSGFTCTCAQMEVCFGSVLVLMRHSAHCRRGN